MKKKIYPKIGLLFGFILLFSIGSEVQSQGPLCQGDWVAVLGKNYRIDYEGEDPVYVSICPSEITEANTVCCMAPVIH